MSQSPSKRNRVVNGSRYGKLRPVQVPQNNAGRSNILQVNGSSAIGTVCSSITSFPTGRPVRPVVAQHREMKKEEVKMSTRTSFNIQVPSASYLRNDDEDEETKEEFGSNHDSDHEEPITRVMSSISHHRRDSVHSDHMNPLTQCSSGVTISPLQSPSLRSMGNQSPSLSGSGSSLFHNAILAQVAGSSDNNSDRFSASSSVHSYDMVKQEPVRRRPPRKNSLVMAAAHCLSPRKKHTLFTPAEDLKLRMQQVEQYKRSLLYVGLEQAYLIGDNLQYRERRIDESIETTEKLLDLDSQDGQSVCRNFLSTVERLFQIKQLPVQERKYRHEFSASYKILYSSQPTCDPSMSQHNINALCYLTEILDSAQEALPHLWVNGEKYIFSESVVDAGKLLYESLKNLKAFIDSFWMQTSEKGFSDTDKLQQLEEQLCKQLVSFDKEWAHYERVYVVELMVIENDARRFIYDALTTEAELQKLETQYRTKPLKQLLANEQYLALREKSVANISALNAVANTQGKGRDDFQLSVLVQAEKVVLKASACKTGKATYSAAMISLATQVCQSYEQTRQLLKRYAANIELLDPQLKNNQDLVQSLIKLENTWSLAMNQISDKAHFDQLKRFSIAIETTGKKHSEFQENIECRDASIFMSLPSLFVLRALQQKEGKESITRFAPSMVDSELFLQTEGLFNQEFDKQKTFQPLEALVLELNTDMHKQQTPFEQQLTKQVSQNIKQLGVELQRCHPVEWNEFLTASMGAE